MTEKALNITLRALGENNEVVAAAYNNIAVLWLKEGDLDKTIDYYEKSLKI